MKRQPVAIEFDFQVRQVKTMADHSINLTLNLPEYAVDVVGELVKRIDDAGRAALVFEPDSKK
jgi:hypothetical protein